MPTPPVPDDLPRSPTGRVPQWVVEESAGRTAADTGFRQWSPTRPASVRPPRRRRVGAVLPALLTAALVGTVAVVALWPAGTDPDPDAAADAAGAAGPSGSSYAFLHVDPLSGDPVGYDPCTPIDVEIRPGGSPADGPAMVQEALDSVTGASGLVFRVLGPTGRAPDQGPDRTLSGYAPVLVAWSDEDESPMLAGHVAGYAGSVSSTRPDDETAARPGFVPGERAYLRTGEVVLDAEDLADVSTPEERAAVVGVISHELGHLVGLDHVDDTGELMHPESQPATARWGPGDLTGLRLLGAVPCEGAAAP